MQFPGVALGDEYSIAMLFALDSSNGFVKLLDFAELQADEGFYNNSGFLVYKNQANAFTPLITPSAYVQLLITRAASGEVIAYLNNAEQFAFSDLTSETVGVNELNFFIDDMVTNSLENADGSVARITLFDRVLAPNEVMDFTELPDIIFLDGFED